MEYNLNTKEIPTINICNIDVNLTINSSVYMYMYDNFIDKSKFDKSFGSALVYLTSLFNGINPDKIETVYRFTGEILEACSGGKITVADVTKISLDDIVEPYKYCVTAFYQSVAKYIAETTSTIKTNADKLGKKKREKIKN